MFKNRFVLIVSVLALLGVTIAVAVPVAGTSEAASLNWPPRPVLIPVSHLSNLNAYYQGERTLVDPNAGLEIYRLSERTLIDPQASLAAYHLSERTRRPSRNLAAFNLYQRSEWFGESEEK